MTSIDTKIWRRKKFSKADVPTLENQNIDMICDESNSSSLINVQNKVSTY